MRIRKIISILLLLVLMLTSFQINNVYADAEYIYGNDATAITRAEWLHNLAIAFDMSVEDEVYPDNYFSDLPTEHKYYKDILLTVQFGVINIEAGKQLRPDDKLTREFAAQTLSFCLGYEKQNTNYTFSDSAQCEYPAYAQIAVDRGWFALDNGNFNPDKIVSTSEVTKMLKDAENLLSELNVSNSYNNKYEYSSNVKEIPLGTEVTVTDENIVTITDTPIEIHANDIFVIYENEIPIAFSAQTVKNNGLDTVITTSTVSDNEVFKTVDSQGTIDAAITDLEALDDTDIMYIDDSSGVKYSLNRAVPKAVLKNVSAEVKKTIKISSTLTVNLKAKIKNPSVKYKLTSGNKFVQLDSDVELSYNIKGNLADGSALSGLKDIRLVNWTVPGVGGFIISTDIEASGTISGVNKGHLTTGLAYDNGSGLRVIRGYQAKGFTITAEATASAGLQAKLGLTDLPFFNGYVYAKAGGKANLKMTNYTDGQEPARCVSFVAWIYAECGAIASFDFGMWEDSIDLKYEIYNEDNSPVRVSHHYENGKEVATCVRDKDWIYHTLASSPWNSSRWSGASGTYGLDGEGKIFTLYDYTLSKDNSDNDVATITKYYGNARDLVIPETLDGYTVVGIGTGAFKGNTYLKSVEIPDTVINIEGVAFSECQNLVSVILPANVENFGYSTFKNCSSLVEINIPKSLKNITTYDGYTSNSAYPFIGCTNLSKLIFEEGITELPANLFAGCLGLTNVTIPKTVTKIGSKTFYGCTNLYTVDVPDSMIEIGTAAFGNCSNLSSVQLPKKLKKLGANAFVNCTSITSICIPKYIESVSTYDGYTSNSAYPFTGCINLTDVKFEEGITVLPSCLLGNCESLTKLDIPNTVTSIGEKFLYNCKNLETVNIPDCVTNIEGFAFYGCSKLTNVQLPLKLHDLGASAFKNCVSIKSVRIPENLAKITTYDGYTSNSAYPFVGCTGLETITYADKCSFIPSCMFGNSGIKTLSIPNGIEKIGSYAFINCTNLIEVEFEEGIKQIEKSAFAGTGIKKIVLPETIEELGTYLFSNCTNLSDVKINSKRKNIMSYMFQNCISLQNIELPNSVTNIQEGAFKGSGIENLVLPDSIVEIGNNAFENSMLSNINIPDKLYKIGNSAFRNCDNLTQISISNFTDSIGAYFCYDCDSLTQVDLGSGIKSIPNAAFEHCDSLQKIQLPYNITTINSNAFKNCIKMTEIRIPRNTTSIASDIFSYPENMTIYGVSRTFAEEYANSSNIRFVDISIKAIQATFTKTEYVLNKGVSYAFNSELNILPTTFTDEVVWKIGNSSIATVDNYGLLNPIAVGETVLKVNVGDISTSCKIKVVQPITSIYLNKSTLSLDGGDSFKLTATVYPNDANNKTLEWISSDSSIVSVDQNGNIIATKKGTAIITVVSKDGSNKSASCTVTVNNDVIEVTEIEKMQSEHPYSNNCSDSWLYTINSAEALKISFDNQTELEDRFDYLVIYDKNNNEIGRYTGMSLSGKSITISGNVVRIKLETDDSGNAFGFKINNILAVSNTDIEKPTEEPTEKPSTNNNQSNTNAINKSTVKYTTPIISKPGIKLKNIKLKKVKISWSKLKYSFNGKVNTKTRFEICYARDSKFKKSRKLKKYSGTVKTTSKTISKLKRNKTYYFKYRVAVKYWDTKVNSWKYKYSKWSKIKKVKIKK